MRPCNLSIFFIVFLFASSNTFAQEVASSSHPAVFLGIVVEQVTKNLAGEKAGLQEGDILLRWARGDVQSNIESPLDLSSRSEERRVGKECRSRWWVHP